MFGHRWISAAILVAVLQAAATTNAHLLSSTEESEVRVVPNPHSSCPHDEATSEAHPGCGAPASSCETSFLLSPHQIIRTRMATQSDTLVEVTSKRVLSASVPVYRFRQPARLSPLELPFRLILVRDIDAAPKGSLHHIPVHPSAAADSWFPGYAWSPVVYSGCGEGGPVHVGWRFANSSGEFFYALIVDAKDEERTAVSFGVAGALGEAIAESLNVGTRAPGWMVDLLTSIM
mmetsp:Transcript_2011/g.4393  ORF Transcript_2011/g.4393 Transcript_2011/m.4393 type:complete len:233 (+) Transcript_2011:88-786(+)|eukprot:CAMPEP_0172543898 /NCGR_PEP_ID=MMETSP1067-20121228/14176_1 /TAXON_ID=265564 ORGANISM="Thalassiosira punctigera, Strain Tpunct2005C2" /NCGR_SAMPLE_ID=MMETSP1067 /ASSEMBLY_ACC=CAM_ASM_000444 /LENGTH=232 /DNA_ID=CAMNT_0013330379 /DNA_START=83 /DNA_END=781 /DNA_ORIENTATION=-